MPYINNKVSYNQETIVDDNDFFIGTSGETKQTKTFSLISVAKYAYNYIFSTGVKTSTTNTIILNDTFKPTYYSAANNQPLTGDIEIDLTSIQLGAEGVYLYSGTSNPNITQINGTPLTLINHEDRVITGAIITPIYFFVEFDTIRYIIADAASSNVPDTTPPTAITNLILTDLNVVDIIPPVVITNLVLTDLNLGDLIPPTVITNLTLTDLNLP